MSAPDPSGGVVRDTRATGVAQARGPGILRAFALRHLLLAAAVTAAYDFLGQLGWIDFGSPDYAARLKGLAQMPVHFVVALLAVAAAVVMERVLEGARLRPMRYPLAVLIASIAGALVLVATLPYFTDHMGRGAPGVLDAAAQSTRHAVIAWNVLKSSYICILMVALYAVFEANRQAGADLHAARMAMLEVERETLEQGLQAVQSRVDPDWLFDALRAVDRAYAQDPASGQLELDALINTLRRAVRADAGSADQAG